MSGERPISLQCYARTHWRYHKMAKSNDPELRARAKSVTEVITFLTDLLKDGNSEGLRDFYSKMPYGFPFIDEDKDEEEDS